MAEQPFLGTGYKPGPVPGLRKSPECRHDLAAKFIYYPYLQLKKPRFIEIR